MLLNNLGNHFAITRDLVSNWSDWLHWLVNCAVRKLLNNQNTNNNDSVNLSLLTDLVKDHLFFEIFDKISNRFNKKSLYSKEDLFAHMKFTFEKYINWSNRLNEKVQVWIYFWFKSENWSNLFVDYLDKDKGRKKYYDDKAFNELLWFDLNKYLENNKKSVNSSYIFIAEKNCLIIVNSKFDNGFYIIYLSWLSDFDKKIVNSLKEKVVVLVRDKIALILAKYIDSMTWCKNSTYLLEHLFTKNLSIAELDISNLKKLNDVYWRDIWDLAIKHFWNILKKCVRKDEWEVVHISWDEFCIIVKRDNTDWHIQIWDNIFLRLQKLKDDWKFKFNFDYNGENIAHEYDFVNWICYNDTEKWNLTLWECLEISDSRLSKKKWSDWLSSRVVSILKDYKFEKQIQALWISIKSLFWNHSEEDKLRIVSFIFNSLNSNN